MTSIKIDGSRLRLEALAGFDIEASTSAEDGLLEAFYRSYDAAFILPNEKEEKDGFAQCLALNAGRPYVDLQSRYGPFREYIAIVRPAGEQPIAGGFNFIAYVLDDPATPDRPVLSVNLNYVFIDPAHRGAGLFTRLISALPEIATALFTATNAYDLPAGWTEPARSGANANRVLVFLEQNDPYAMSHDDYELDTAFAGIDQRLRIATWARRGAKIVDLDYVQPALTAGQSPDRTLIYSVIGSPRNWLHPRLLRDHLERFFAISVLKGKDPATDAVAARQLLALEAMAAGGCSVALLSIDNPAMLPKPTWAGNQLGSLRALLKSPTRSREQQ